MAALGLIHVVTWVRYNESVKSVTDTCTTPVQVPRYFGGVSFLYPSHEIPRGVGESLVPVIFGAASASGAGAGSDAAIQILI